MTQYSAKSSGSQGEDESFPVPNPVSADSSAAEGKYVPQEQTLVFILDLTPTAWASTDSRLQLYNLYNILYRFLKTYAFMSARNRCCIIATHSVGCRILYEGIVSNDWLNSCFLGINNQNEHVDTNITSIWQEMLSFIAAGAQSSFGDPQLTTAISMGLLYLNRLKKTGAGYGRRILLFDVSNADGYKSQYIGLMNAAFTASKSEVSINTCAFGQSSRILEQLSDITNAKYLSLRKILKSEPDLQNYDQSITQLLTLPFDFSNTAVCYCHYNTVDIAFICPCCFAVYCSEKEENGKYRISCIVCNSRLTKQLVKQKTAGDADFYKT